MDYESVDRTELDHEVREVLLGLDNYDLAMAVRAYGVLAFVRSTAIALTGKDPQMIDIWNASGSLQTVRFNRTSGEVCRLSFSLASNGPGAAEELMERAHDLEMSCETCPAMKALACRVMGFYTTPTVDVIHDAAELLFEIAVKAMEALGLPPPDAADKDQLAASESLINETSHRIFAIGHVLAEERGILGQIKEVPPQFMEDAESGVQNNLQAMIAQRLRDAIGGGGVVLHG